MHPIDCPDFEYANHPSRQEILERTVTEILSHLRRGTLDTLANAVDTRSIHRTLFKELTPASHDYYAGHYRGEPYRCLRHYPVGIPSDSRVGYPPEGVLGTMRLFAREIEVGIEALDFASVVPHSILSEENKLLYAVVFVSRIFELFLRIHPYANGNGHAARFLVWAILGRFGYWPANWPIDPRPPDPPYTELIARYRNGDREPLESFMVKAIAGS